jgi:hypothetical protein
MRTPSLIIRTLSLVTHRVRFKKNLQKSTLEFKGGWNSENWVSSWRSFLLSASTAAASIFTAPNCTTTIISLEPCALNAEFQHSILSWSISYWDLINIFTLRLPLKEGIGGERRPKDRVKRRLLYSIFSILSCRLLCLWGKSHIITYNLDLHWELKIFH